mgnify:CR=1 FL=1
MDKKKTIITEHSEQVALFRWAELNVRKYPELSLMFAIPNGGHRHIAVARRLKAEGVRAGVPDIQLPVPRGDWVGLWIEMKSKRGKCSPTQLGWHTSLVAAGHRVEVCYGCVDARNVILKYLAG